VEVGGVEAQPRIVGDVDRLDRVLHHAWLRAAGGAALHEAVAADRRVVLRTAQALEAA
jgi:hypothetical protein